MGACETTPLATRRDRHATPDKQTRNRTPLPRPSMIIRRSPAPSSFVLAAARQRAVQPDPGPRDGSTGQLRRRIRKNSQAQPGGARSQRPDPYALLTTMALMGAADQRIFPQAASGPRQPSNRPAVPVHGRLRIVLSGSGALTAQPPPGPPGSPLSSRQKYRASRCSILFPPDAPLPSHAGLRSITLTVPTPLYAWSLAWRVPSPPAARRTVARIRRSGPCPALAGLRARSATGFRTQTTRSGRVL
jgi:hypothetical protein